jgi:hypothetical protein
MGRDAWNMLFAGKCDEAIDAIEIAYSSRFRGSIPIIEACLFAKDFQRATSAVVSLLADERKRRSPSETAFALAGTLYWLQHLYSEGVLHWTTGLASGYGRPGGLGIPLLLWYVVKRRPALVDASFVLSKLAERRKGKWTSNEDQDKWDRLWPVPAARFALGEIGVSDLLALAAEEGVPIPVQARQQAEAHFYAGVGLLTSSDETAAILAFQTCISLSTQHRHLCSEFFLARFELEMIKEVGKQGAKKRRPRNTSN